MPYAQRALHLIDQNPYSPTYGCFDRNYWHYRTSDFPCGMVQQMSLLLALFYIHDFPDNPYYKVERIRELAIAGTRYAAKSAHPDGSCDDYFPYEKALGGLAFSLYGCTETLLMLDEKDESIISFFGKRAKLLRVHQETGRLSNHQALAALALYNTSLLTHDDSLLPLVQDRVSLVLSWQHKEEGWFQEYEGADPGYQTCTIDFLAKLMQKAAVASNQNVFTSLEKPLINATRFCSNFIHPDGSYGGEYGSRNTSHFFPHGFELVSQFEPIARTIITHFLDGAEKGKPYRNDDDRMAPLPATSYLQAWIDHNKSNSFKETDKFKNELIHLKDSGLFIARFPSPKIIKQNNHLIVNMHKGGVLKFYDNLGPIASDTGICAELLDGTILVSHLYQEKDFLAKNHYLKEKGSLICEGRLYKRSTNLLNPITGLLFRLWCLTFSRMFKNITRKIIQKIAITGKRPSKYHFKRIINIDVDQITVYDYLPADMPVKRLSAGSDATSIYVAGSQSFHESRLCPWQNVGWNDLPLEKGKKIWKRSYYRGSGHSNIKYD